MIVFRLQSGGVVAFGDQARFAQWSGRAFRDWPLVGVPTTGDLYGGDRGVFQPGPIETYLMAPFVWALGVDVGPQVFAAVVNVMSVLVASSAGSMVAGRRGAAVVAVGALFMFAVVIPGHATDALNVYIVVGPLFAVYVLAAALWSGRFETLAPLVIAVSFVVQTHVAYGAVAMLVSTSACIAFVIRGRSHGWPVGTVRHLRVAAAAGALIWFPPLVDQIVGSGNLTRLLTMSIPHRGMDGAISTLYAVFDPATLSRCPVPVCSLPDRSPAPTGIRASDLVWPCIFASIAVVGYRMARRGGGSLVIRVAGCFLIAFTAVVSIGSRLFGLPQLLFSLLELLFGLPPALLPPELSDADLTRRSLWSLVAVLVLVMVFVRRYQDHRALVLTACTVVGATAVVGALLPTDDQPTYHLYFIRATSAFLLVVLVLLLDPLRWLPISQAERAWRVPAALVLVSVFGSLYWVRAVPSEATSREMNATRTLSEVLDRELPVRGDFAVVPRGGIRAYLVAAGVAARLDRGERRVSLSPEFGAATTLLMVVQGAADFPANGELVARHEPPGAAGISSRAASEASQWIEENGPVKLNPVVDSILATYVDGALPALCTRQLLDAPRLLLDMPPEVITNLAFERAIAAPLLTPRVERVVTAWSEAEAVSVRRLTRSQISAVRTAVDEERDPLVLSSSSC